MLVGEQMILTVFVIARAFGAETKLQLIPVLLRAPADRAFVARRLIVLHEGHIKPRLLHVALVVRLHEVPAAVPVNGGLDDVEPLDAAHILFHFDLSHQYSIRDGEQFSKVNTNRPAQIHGRLQTTELGRIEHEHAEGEKDRRDDYGNGNMYFTHGVVLPYRPCNL